MSPAPTAARSSSTSTRSCSSSAAPPPSPILHQIREDNRRTDLPGPDPDPALGAFPALPALGRDDARGRAGHARDRHRQLGPVRHRPVDAVLPVLAARAPHRGRRVPRPRRRREVLRAPVHRPAPHPGAAQEEAAARAPVDRGRRGRVGDHQRARRLPLARVVDAVLRAQLRTARRLGHRLVRRARPHRLGEALGLRVRQRPLPGPVRPVLPRHRRPRLLRADAGLCSGAYGLRGLATSGRRRAAARAAVLPRRGRVPALRQGLVAAVRAVAHPARRARPPQMGHGSWCGRPPNCSTSSRSTARCCRSRPKTEGRGIAEGLFLTAAASRWIAVAIMCALVVQEILIPRLDAVRSLPLRPKPAAPTPLPRGASDPAPAAAP